MTEHLHILVYTRMLSGISTQDLELAPASSKGHEVSPEKAQFHFLVYCCHWGPSVSFLSLFTISPLWHLGAVASEQLPGVLWFSATLGCKVISCSSMPVHVWVVMYGREVLGHLLSPPFFFTILG